jgi:hypothetical protein
MGFAAISHEDHRAHMGRTQKFSINQALERYALLVRNREERVVGGELEVQQPALFTTRRLLGFRRC